MLHQKRKRVLLTKEMVEMATQKERRAQARQWKMRGLKLSFLSLITFGIGGWFAIKKPILGVVAILLQGLNLVLMLFGIGVIFFGIIWFGSSIYMQFYPMLSHVGTVFDRLEDQVEYKEQLKRGSARAV